MEQEEEDGGDWLRPQSSNIVGWLSLGCRAQVCHGSTSSCSSSKMPFAFTAATTARVEFRPRQTQSAGQIARLVRPRMRKFERPSWGAKLLILGLVALAWRELFSSSGRIDLSIGRRGYAHDDDNERLRQLAHCPLAVCPPRASLVGAEISGPSNRFGPLFVFAAADQSLNTSASGGVGGGGQVAQPNNNTNNETTTQAAAASDLRAKVAADANTDGANTRTDQDQQQQQQQQRLKKVDLNITRTTTTTTAGDSDLPLIIMTKQRQQDEEQQQQQGDLTAGLAARMTSVVCNSRCRCVQLELANKFAAVDRRADKQNDGGLAGWLAKLGGLAPSSSSSSSSNQIESMMSLPRDNNEIASDTNSSAGETAKSNKIALIEFSQDYSFDELDEFERGPDESQEQTTTTTTTVTTMPLAGTGNGNHHAGLAASSASTHGKLQRPPPANGNAKPVAIANSAIKHANDQSKDVNVSAATLGNVTATSASTTQRPPPPPPQPPTLLSIKYNKTSVQAPQLGTLYPHYLNMAAHHQHHNPRGQRHKLMPAAAVAAAFNQQMSAQQQQQQKQLQEEAERMQRVERISPLRSLNLTRGNGQLNKVETIVQMLKDVEAQGVQSLVLSHNQLAFETWTQLYGLLAVPLRRHIYHLDLSHNSLAKLGVTFTGYIEHHLVHQLIVQHNQSWPFSSPMTQNQSSYLQFKLSTAATGPSGSSSSPGATDSSTTRAQKQHQKLLSQQQQLRHPNLGEGKLYNAVRSELPVMVSSLLVQQATAHHQENTTNELPTQSPVHRKSQSARMPQTILHQPARVKALDLSYNKLEWLINDQFRVLKHVESIRLDHNQIRYIHQQAFNGLEELKYLNLNYNRIQTIYMEQFQTNFNLRALFLQSNYLTYLRADSLAALDKLKRLDLSRNKFSLLSNNAFAGLDSLEFLNLSSNQFVHVPSTSFHSLAAASLRELDLSRNQLAQLMPGTFFHLKLERLWLDENAQLVAIDRGAFWDLPYLSELSLRSNQMLLNINSQAFVGLPNIRAINYNECPLLDADTKQMLDNVTRAATLRHLIQIKQSPATSEPQVAASERPAQWLASINGSTISGTGNGSSVSPASHQHEHMRLQMGSDLLQQQQVPFDQTIGGGGAHGQPTSLLAKSAMKYVYSAGCLVFIVIALKFVFSFTSTGNRLGEGRRRRRRVYQSSASSLSSAGAEEDSLSSSTASATSATSSAVNYCDELPPPPGCINGFAMCEQQPQGAISSGGGGGSEPASRGQDQPPPPSLQPGECEPSDNLDSQEQAPSTCCDLNQLQVVVAAAASSANCTCPDCCAQVGQQVCMVSPDGIGNVGAETGLAPMNGNDGHQSDTFQVNSYCDIPTTTTNANSAETMPVTTGAGASDEAGRSQQDSAAMELIHDQLVVAGYGDYGHAKCAHFYQSLGPALQLADLTASLVNQMDYY